MRVLLISHLFPPAHQAGTELYTAELGRRIVAAGHEVHVLCTDKDIGREDGSLERRDQDGLVVHELVNNLYHEDFVETWSRPELDERFEGLLEELQPDLIHVNHLMYLSTGMLAVAKGRGLPVVYTLHDFWLACPRFGQLLHTDGKLCERVDFDRCGTCLPSFGWRQSPFQSRVGRTLAVLHKATGVDLGPFARSLASRMALGGDSGDPAAVGEGEQAAWSEEAHRRSEALLERVRAHVDSFVAPSEFLRDWLVDWGLPGERVQFLPTGVDQVAFGAPPRRRDLAQGPLRVAFVGTVVPVKGVHLLVDAWERIGAGRRERARLRIHGPRDHAPGYQSELDQRSASLGVEFTGALERDQVAGALADCDLLVVPSVWFENRPLVVLEALATGTPLLVSSPGGMVELVREGVHGWHFPLGDAAALAERIGQLIDDPTPLGKLYPEPVQLPTWDALVHETLQLYERLLAAEPS